MKKSILSFILVMIFFTACEEKKDISQSSVKEKLLTINPDTMENQVPVANDDNAALVSGESKVINVLSNDTDNDGRIDVTTVNIVTDPQYGIVSVNADTGEVTYLSNGSDKGEDNFTYTVQDDQNTISNVATVSLDLEVVRQSNKIEIKPSNWYIRLVAEDAARGLSSGSSQLGELDKDQVIKKHTLKALAPFGGSYLDIIFRNPPAVSSGDYKVSFHRYNEGEEGRWSFTVRTNDNQADIFLFWRGIYILTPYIDEQNRQRYKEYQSLINPLTKNMKLIDSSNGKQVAAILEGKVQKYQFNMNGQTERNFEWVVQKEEVSLSAKSNKSLVIEGKKQIIEKKVEIFDLGQPPLLNDER